MVAQCLDLRSGYFTDFNEESGSDTGLVITGLRVSTVTRLEVGGHGVAPSSLSEACMVDDRMCFLITPRHGTDVCERARGVGTGVEVVVILAGDLVSVLVSARRDGRCPARGMPGRSARGG
jgi:hypothetical protein